MESLKNNTILFYVLGLFTGSGVVLLKTEYFGAGIILLIAAGVTLTSLFWDEIKQIFK